MKRGEIEELKKRIAASETEIAVLSSRRRLAGALDLKADIASPTLTGTPAAPTAAVNTNTTQIATTEYVDRTSREKLAAARTYYVRTDGSDSNTGLANTAGAAFLTIQNAINAAATLDTNGYVLTISVASGTYAGSVSFKNVHGAYGAGACKLVGDTTTPANVVISSSVITDGLNTPWYFEGFKITSTGYIASYRNSILFVGDIEMAGTTSNFRVATGGQMLCGLGNLTISGAARLIELYNEGGMFNFSSITVTYVGCPNHTNAFANANYIGMTYLNAVTFVYPSVTFASGTDRCTLTAHGRAANDPVSFQTTGAMPNPLVAGTTYYVKTVVDANTITLSATAGGALIDLTTDGSGCTAMPVGTRYRASANSIVFVNGGGATYLPGNSAGILATQGQYF